MKNELVIVLDFGGQYNQLVARRVRECNVYCEIYSYRTDLAKIKEMNPKGIILTGGPNSCYLPDSPTYTDELFKLGIPVLGLCYGAQLMMHVLGGEVKKADVREYGKTEVLIDKTASKVFEGVSTPTVCWMSHFDYIAQVAPGFEITAHTADCPVAAAENEAEKLYAIQFHPEVLHTVEGTKMINNFVKNVCGCVGDWTRKGGVICSEILLPSYAPPDYADRETLWNAVEKAERGKNAQLAYSFDIALQNEFSMEENIDIARQFLLDNFVSRGMVVDFSVHSPDKENGGISNPHFHVMCPIRPIEPDGKWGNKQRREYVLDEHGNRIRDEAGNDVFNAVPTTDWGSPETLESWRQA